MNTLDKDRLDFLIRSLTQARKYGFSSLSSPVEILLEAGTDLMLILSDKFDKGAKSLPLNKEIGFSQFSQDALGNPKQFVIQKKNPMFQDQEASKYLKKLASFLVALKNRQSFSKALRLAELTVERPSTSQSKLGLETTLNLKEKRAEFRLNLQKQRAYYRRQRNKNRLS